MIDKVIRYSLGGGLPLVIFVVAMVSGLLALQLTPREEEPQIVVPMVDVLVNAPGLSAKQVERQVTTPLEKLLAQISGVEHIYSTSATGQASATLRFYVGEDREDSILNTYNKLYSNQDKIPPVVSDWLVRPVEVDDVPIVLLALWSNDPDRYSDFELRRLAEEVSTYLQSINHTSEVKIVGGRPRTIRLLIDPESLAARKTTASEIISALQVSNLLQQNGRWTLNNQSIVLESGDFIRSLTELRNMVVNIIDGDAVYLRDVVEIVDGPAEADSYTWIEFSRHHPQFAQLDNTINTNFPMVAISIAKQRGSNAVNVANDVHALVAQLKNELLPPQIEMEVLRDYGQTADEKVNNLVQSLVFAIFTIVIFIGVFLGWRAAAVIALALPICYGVTLALDMAFGYTINRVTLFALILALGLLVDDPITGVDNISRFISDDKLTKHDWTLQDKIVAAILEIKTPLIMSTVTIVLAFVPLAFITGMMGPYMAPMAFNVPVSVISSTVVAFLVTPWLARWLLKPGSKVEEKISADTQALQTTYGRWMSPLLGDRSKAKMSLWVVASLFVIAASLPLFRLVPLKLLPFDNKNEVQILIDMPESSSLEQTAAMAKTVGTILSRVPEVQAIAAFVGTPSPIDFNGMVRRYYQRQQPYLADLRLTLLDKSEREHQSHGIVLRLRELLAPYQRDGVQLKVIEVPPGPPVLSTLVAEVYGGRLIPYEQQQAAAADLMTRLSREAHVVEIDSSVEAPAPRLRFITDKPKAALSGVATADINTALTIANHGYVASYFQEQREATPLPIELRLAPEQRTSTHDLERLHVKGRPNVIKTTSATGIDAAPQPLVALGELGQFEWSEVDRAIHHKDLKPVVYVTAELSGRTPAEVIADVHADLIPNTEDLPEGDISNWENRNYLSNGAGDYWQLPQDIDIKWRGEGEWRITVDVFRDMGIAFAFALIAIFMILRVQTQSAVLSLIIMSAIPLTIIGIMPGFWLLNQFGEREIAGAPEPVLFTATAMIGMIALAGIVVRNSLILVEFISQARERGATIPDALLLAGSVRMRPVLLTAGTTLLGNLIITLDPVFSGLALAIIFGIVASTLFTLVVVPVVYLLVFEKPTATKTEEVVL
jgi:multidrug efflux pump subunit AcrB